MDSAGLIQSSLILFAIINPIGSLPIFLQLTQGLSAKERSKAFQTAVGVATIILFVFLLIGRSLLTNFFQIQFADLMAAAGLLLIIIAIDHLVFGSLVRNVVTDKRKDGGHIGAVPMACPILAGPGAMMSVLLIFNQHGIMTAAAAILINIAFTAFLFRFIDQIYKFLGEMVCTVLSKILCLFIAAIGMRLLMNGLLQYFR